MMIKLHQIGHLPAADALFFQECISIRPAYPIPVSYTHLDVYKRQYLRYGLSVKAVVFCVIFALLIVISGIDLSVMEIPDGLNLLLALCGVLLVVSDPSYTFTQALLGAIIVSLPLEAIALFTGGIGGGDVKLMAALGLCLGPKLIVLTFFFGCISAAIVSVGLMAAQKVSRRSLIPLGPFLALGAVASVLWGRCV